MRNLIGRQFLKAAHRLGVELPQQSPKGRLLWNDAQKFELKHALAFMDHPGFKEWVSRFDDPQFLVSNGFRDKYFVAEFFGGDDTLAAEFFDHVTGKTVLDVGPCVFSPTSVWDVAAKRIIIEPLYDEVSRWQIDNRGRNLFVNIDEAYSSPAEKFIPELVAGVNGAVLVRNCIDHSPQWPFILSNIAKYMTPGAVLLLWNDLLHPPEYLDGHYDITDDPIAFRRLLETMGFKIEYEFVQPNSTMLDYGCRAVLM
ncbi:hypothetical protein ACIQUB_31430 [Rhizobium sp. NPDC090275]|uniref:hypothetical protein n=1 Tax=Rhizobium sp. NPDC090275 TaxID=3364498 RepID=UPI000DD525DC